MAAVGLAQNFAAMRALVTDGIQRGHMALHARGLAVAAGAPEGLVEQVVEGLIASGEIKLSKARQILEAVQLGG
jgi:hydroxymethylglutaryl-CoA reductase